MPLVMPSLSDAWSAAAAAPLRVNGARLNEWLTKFDSIGRTPTGINRVAYSEADLAGRAFTLQLLRDAGLTPRIDTAGNIYARLDGTDRTLAPILIGSHIDSVTDGGNFDGPVGSFGAIEVARTLREQAVRLRHPLDVVIWQNEEGGTTGSKIAVGEITDAELAKVARSGITIRDGIGRIGGDVSRLGEAVKKQGDIACYIELHIEQGGLLEKAGKQIGVVQGIVESILSDTSSMLGLTTLREFDDYTFVHSVNVSILSVALGRRLGLTKPQLLDLGLAALMHDIGKSRLPVDLLNKREGLTDEERALLQTHAWQGVLTLLAMPTAAARPWRSMTAAYEHHMRIDLSGYPAPEYPRRLSLFSRIISVADGFDAATSARVYRSHTWTPAEVLQGMRDNPALGLDQVVVKAFVNLMGIYPIGTLVVLDSLAMAVVVSTSADPSALSRPVVRLISDEVGNRYAEPVFHDLTARDDAGRFLLTIVRTEDPDTHDIIISDYVC